MRVIDIKPVDVEVDMVFTLTELRNINIILKNGAIYRTEGYEEEMESFSAFREYLDNITKEQE